MSPRRPADCARLDRANGHVVVEAQRTSDLVITGQTGEAHRLGQAKSAVPVAPPPFTLGQVRRLTGADRLVPMNHAVHTLVVHDAHGGIVHDHEGADPCTRISSWRSTPIAAPE